MAANKENVESAEAADADEASIVPETPAQRRMRIVKEHLWGPTGSVIIHILVLIALFTLVQNIRPKDDSEIEVTYMEPVTEDLDKFKKKLEELQELQPTENLMENPTFDQPISEQQVDNPTATPNVDMTAFEIKTDFQSPLVMKGLWEGRSAEGRSRGLGRGRYGGAAEAAVIKALRWLKEHQLPDGSWDGAGSKPAMTGLALLTYLAHNELPGKSKEFGETVRKAIEWLMDQHKKNGDGSFVKSGHGTVYANAIGLYAMAEAYGMTRIPELKEVIESGSRYIIKGMQDTGAYTYNYEKNGRRDTSVAGWQAQALKSAFIAGAEVEGLKEALEKVAKGLFLNFNANSGSFMYAPPEANNGGPNISAIAVLALQLLGYGEDKRVKAAIATMEEWRCSWDDRSKHKGHCPIYAYYYGTQAKFHASETIWKAWEREFAPAYIKAQNADGSWTPMGKTEDKYGPVYGTTFAALTLTVYYRFLPTYQKIEAKPIEGEEKQDDGEVQIL